MDSMKYPIKSQKQIDEFFSVLKMRFEKNMNRHANIDWAKIEARLKKDNKKLESLYEMERTGGEPDVIEYDKKTDTYIFVDCAEESPKDRRNLCYDREALNARKEHKPKDTAVDMAKHMGIEILTEEEYKKLQQLGEFDLKTSSWLKTPENIRTLGGAIFADRRYNQVFVFHNGADSYYSSRGFRGILRV